MKLLEYFGLVLAAACFILVGINIAEKDWLGVLVMVVLGITNFLNYLKIATER